MRKEKRLEHIRPLLSQGDAKRDPEALLGSDALLPFHFVASSPDFFGTVGDSFGLDHLPYPLLAIGGCFLSFHSPQQHFRG